MQARDYLHERKCVSDFNSQHLIEHVLYVPGIVLKAGDAEDEGTALSCAMELIDV